MSEPLAHSAHAGAAEQTYRDHVSGVIRLAAQFGSEATAFSPNRRKDFLAALEMAANYHDLGKLDDIFQEDLSRNRRTTRLNHVDAGSAHLLRGKHAEAAVAVYAHHLGLPSFPDERAKNANAVVGMFRDLESEAGGAGLKTFERTDTMLPEYLALHHSIFPPFDRASRPFKSGLVRRLLLSCLVDADHTDTARHYGSERAAAPPGLQPAARLEALDRYVAELSRKASAKTEPEALRQRLRDEIYRACRERAVRAAENIFSCDSPVGTGKTTAVVAHLLRVAAERGLRRVFVILPFTNIIDQSVDVYRQALRLPDESAAEMKAVVAAHHHRVDFSGDRIEAEQGSGAKRVVQTHPELRQLAALWESPVVVTTAVQFFETLAASATGALRKFHRVAGSSIFVDEAHAAMPAALWPQMLRWLRELCDDWGCHVVLASGSLARFWTLDEFVRRADSLHISDLVGPDVASRAKELEALRVRIRTRRDPLPLPDLAEFVLSKPGPRLVILNTVQSAAVFAKYLREECRLGLNVEHISTALTPLDRAKTVQRVRQNLSSPWRGWCLVATSCVEAGLDFSFRSAFRESWGLVNLLQVAGRASRSGEYRDAEVWDFRHDGSGGLASHPQAKLPRQILRTLLDRCESEGRSPSPEDCTEALRQELREDRGAQALRIEEIGRAEESQDYPETARLCRIIDEPTETVLIDPDLVRRIESCDRRQFPSWPEVAQNSVQIWASRLDPGKWPVKAIGPGKEVWAWVGRYDGFLGFMAGVDEVLQQRLHGSIV